MSGSPATRAQGRPRRRLTPRARRDRVVARRWVLQVHYRWEAGFPGDSLSDTLSEVATTRAISSTRLPYILEVIELMDHHLNEIDEALQSVLDNWRLDRLSHIDRAVLRIAATEILHVRDVPIRVSIKEAIRLAERYGGSSSPGFVNGVLDALYRRGSDGLPPSSLGTTGPDQPRMVPER